jgi:hypothetical protein
LQRDLRSREGHSSSLPVVVLFSIAADVRVARVEAAGHRPQNTVLQSAAAQGALEFQAFSWGPVCRLKS